MLSASAGLADRIVTPERTDSRQRPHTKELPGRAILSRSGGRLPVTKPGSPAKSSRLRNGQFPGAWSGGVTNYRDAVLFLALAAVWGSAFPAIKAGLEAGFEPVLFAAVRYDVAGVVMLAYAARVSDRWLPRTRADWTTVGIAAVLMIAAYHAFLFVGEQQTTSAVAAVVVSLSPVLTTGFARAFLPSERLSVAGLAGLALGLVGVVVLSNPDPENLLAGNTVGVLLVLSASTCFALGSVLTQRVDDDLSIETMEAWSMLLGAGLMHVVSLAAGEPQTVPRNTEALFAIAYLSL